MSEQNKIERLTDTVAPVVDAGSIEIDLSAVMGAIPVEATGTDSQLKLLG